LEGCGFEAVLALLETVSREMEEDPAWIGLPVADPDAVVDGLDGTSSLTAITEKEKQWAKKALAFLSSGSHTLRTFQPFTKTLQTIVTPTQFPHRGCPGRIR
jgi:hypothetical protein